MPPADFMFVISTEAEKSLARRQPSSVIPIAAEPLQNEPPLDDSNERFLGDGLRPPRNDGCWRGTSIAHSPLSQPDIG
jgi:hypothetical protein